MQEPEVDCQRAWIVAVGGSKQTRPARASRGQDTSRTAGPGTKIIMTNMAAFGSALPQAGQGADSRFGRLIGCQHLPTHRQRLRAETWSVQSPRRRMLRVGLRWDSGKPVEGGRRPLVGPGYATDGSGVESRTTGQTKASQITVKFISCLRTASGVCGRHLTRARRNEGSLFLIWRQATQATQAPDPEGGGWASSQPRVVVSSVTFRLGKEALNLIHCGDRSRYWQHCYPQTLASRQVRRGTTSKTLATGACGYGE
jgi:hypothetical protein